MHLHTPLADGFHHTRLLRNPVNLSKNIQFHQAAIAFFYSLIFWEEALAHFSEFVQVAI
jgi:hypothetical protein